MPYSSRKSIGGVFLIIPAMMVMLYNRILFLSSVQPDPFVVILSEVTLIGGSAAIIIGAILFVAGIPETRRLRRILEVVLVRKEITISEISTQTGFDTEYIRKAVSNLIGTSYLFGFLENDRFILFPHQTYDGQP
jgi:hypothetical protein